MSSEVDYCLYSRCLHVSVVRLQRISAFPKFTNFILAFGHYSGTDRYYYNEVSITVPLVWYLLFNSLWPGVAMHMESDIWVNIESNNGLSSVRHQGITWTNDDSLTIGPFSTCRLFEILSPGPVPPIYTMRNWPWRGRWTPLRDWRWYRRARSIFPAEWRRHRQESCGVSCQSSLVINRIDVEGGVFLQITVSDDALMMTCAVK